MLGSGTVSLLKDRTDLMGRLAPLCGTRFHENKTKVKLQQRKIQSEKPTLRI